MLTKEKAIAEHRKMWHWIADRYESGVTYESGEPLRACDIKLSYFRQAGLPRYPLYNCFCCEYAKKPLTDCTVDCRECPIKWGRPERYVKQHMCLRLKSSPYRALDAQKRVPVKDAYVSSAECAELARKIAELPEA